VFSCHRYRKLIFYKALAVAYHAAEDAAINSIASSTHAILLFGSPVNSGNELESIASSLLTESDDQIESASMKAMKRDARWLHGTNQQFKDIPLQFEMTHFCESALVSSENPDVVSIPLPLSRSV
jgi:hypothetical protein